MNCQCGDGDIRLVNGETGLEGEVEICFSNEWGTICDDGWGPNDATVACRQLGFTAEGTEQLMQKKKIMPLILAMAN